MTQEPFPSEDNHRVSVTNVLVILITLLIIVLAVFGFVAVSLPSSIITY